MFATRRKTTESDDEILQLNDRAARDNPLLASARRFAPRLRRAGDHDVACLGIAEDIFDACQSRNVAHRLVGAVSRSELPLHSAFKPRQRHLAKIALLGEVRIECCERLLRSLLEQLTSRILDGVGVQDTVGVHGNTRKRSASSLLAPTGAAATAAAESATTTTTAAKLGMRRIRQAETGLRKRRPTPKDQQPVDRVQSSKRTSETSRKLAVGTTGNDQCVPPGLNGNRINKPDKREWRQSLSRSHRKSSISLDFS